MGVRGAARLGCCCCCYLESASKMADMNYTNLALYCEGGIAEIFGPRAMRFAMNSIRFLVLSSSIVRENEGPTHTLPPYLKHVRMSMIPKKYVSLPFLEAIAATEGLLPVGE